MRLPGNKVLGVLCSALFLYACGEDTTRIPPDTPGFVKGRAVHPTIKIGKPYRVMGRKYYPEYDPDYEETGLASWYGPNFHGKMTANGETFNQWAMTAAHTTLPLPSMVRVTDLKTGKSIVVRVNDRGPFARGRIIDLSRAAAEALGTRARGLAKVRVKYLPEETEAYIAKLQLKKPEAWQEVDLAKARVEKALHEKHAVSEVEVSDVPQPTEEADSVPEHFAYEGELKEATTIDVRGVVMEEIGYAQDAFSVLDEAALNSVVTAPASSQQPEPIPTPQAADIFVSAGTFSDQAKAIELAKRLTVLSASEVHPVPRAGESPMWRVQLGPFFNRGIAAEIIQKLEGYGIQDATMRKGAR